jgi:hypothetical protein
VWPCGTAVPAIRTPSDAGTPDQRTISRRLEFAHRQASGVDEADASFGDTAIVRTGLVASVGALLESPKSTRRPLPRRRSCFASDCERSAQGSRVIALDEQR